MTYRASNTAAVESAAAQAGDVGDDCTHVTLWDALIGGNLLWGGAINTDPSPLALGERFQIAAGALRLEYTAATGETADMEERVVNGKIAGGVWVQYHTADPGSAGTDNVINIARTPVAENGFTVANV